MDSWEDLFRRKHNAINSENFNKNLSKSLELAIVKADVKHLKGKFGEDLIYLQSTEMSRLLEMKMVIFRNTILKANNDSLKYYQLH